MSRANKDEQITAKPPQQRQQQRRRAASRQERHWRDQDRGSYSRNLNLNTLLRLGILALVSCLSSVRGPFLPLQSVNESRAKTAGKTWKER